MKTHEFPNGLKIEIAESLDDINIARSPAFKEYLLYQQTGEDLPTAISFFADFCNNFNNNDPGGMLIAAYNHYNALRNVQLGDDIDQLLFSIMSYEPDEDRTTWDKTKAKEKLKRLADAGLSQGFVKKEVENFITGLMKL